MSEKETWLPSIELLEETLKEERRRKKGDKAFHWSFFLFVALVAAIVALTVLLTPIIQIRGSAMEPTLNNKDIVVAIKNRKYVSGDVIALSFHGNYLVKRVIATGGEWVDIDKDGNVYVNGAVIDEPYLGEKSFGECDIKLPYLVPDGMCFVMGDQRRLSLDSRNSAIGCVSDEDVIGRLLWRIWPLNAFGSMQ